MDSICISLQHRQDKREEVVKEFPNLGVNPHWFFSIKDTAGTLSVGERKRNGILGCRDSHFSCMGLMKDSGVFMILEDDALCLADNAKEKVDGAMSELPSDWDALWLGSNLQQPLERFSDRLLRLKRGWTTHAIVWNNQNGVIDYILKHKDEIYKLDVFLADNVQENFNCFVIYPMLVTQKQWDSDIFQRTDASKILRNYTRFTK